MQQLLKPLLFFFISRAQPRLNGLVQHWPLNLF